jgi:hypothetical protein
VQKVFKFNKSDTTVLVFPEQCLVNLFFFKGLSDDIFWPLLMIFMICSFDFR